MLEKKIENQGSPFEKYVVVVEDDPSFSKLWERLLSDIPSIQFKVLTSPEDAIQWVKRSPVDILFTDLKMPQMDGITMIEQIRRFNPEMKIIVTSAFIDDTTAFDDLDHFIHIIKKPYKNINYVTHFIKLLIENGDEISNVEKRDPLGSYVWDL